MGTPAKEEEGPDVSGKGMVWQHGWEPRPGPLADSPTYLKTPRLGRADMRMRHP